VLSLATLVMPSLVPTDLMLPMELMPPLLTTLMVDILDMVMLV